ncbi:MAG TPA: bacterial transcriptional activator domain-containing protein, partial [Actinophytocola sp.]|uniref:AfsR/SARP family transcriptional regulator n=1 Tax=Actinophytocola sp. TaxID=1872138 RepID=UPI002DDCE521
GLLRRGRRTGAEAALRTGEPELARTLAEAAITADPLDEAAYRLLIRAHADAGRPAHALAEYHRLRESLATELGIDPAPPTRALHRSILQRRCNEARQAADLR